MAASRRHSFLFLVSLIPVLALTLAGCSSGGGSSDVLAAPTSTSQRVTNVMQGVVIPTLNQLGFDSSRVESPPTAAGATTLSPQAARGANSAVGGAGSAAANETAGEGCFDLSGACASGVYQWCSDPNGLRFEYDTCDRPAGVVDGSWLLSLNGGLSAEYALSIGNLDLSGGISYLIENSCLVHNLGSFTATRPEVTTSLDGSISFCNGSDPEGELEFLVVDEESTFRLTLTMTPDGSSVIVEFETSSENCTVDLGSGDAECTDLA